MTLSARQLADPEFLRELAEHNRGVARARRAYQEQPIAFARAHADCDAPYCHNVRAAKGLCERHLRIYKRDRGEAGA